MEFLRATYRLLVDESAARARAEELTLEQTAELPRAAVRDPRIERDILGRVESIEADPRGGVRARVAFPVAATALDPAQLINVLFGNVSLQEDVLLVDVELPEALRVLLSGPRFGIAGLRKAADVHDRALTCTALKPMGLSPEALAGLCERFARAGIDVIKDDHGLADAPFCPFEARVEACQAAVERAAAETGRRALYAPNLIGTPTRVFEQLRIAEAHGVGAVLVSPMLVGLPVFFELCRERAAVPVLAHPALAGAPRIAADVLFGILFRALGADAVIYTHWGGRFGYSAELCGRIAERLRGDLVGMLPSLPVPAGGMSVDRSEELCKFYGTDAMFLVGSSLYLAGDALEERAREFVERVRQAAGVAA